MHTTVGISAGSDVVCCALLTSSPNGSESFDYRVITADDSHSDVGDLVSSALDLATTNAGDGVIDQVAVTYRTEEQAQSIRTSSRYHEITLVPETPAALSYLRHTGEVARYEDIVIVDLGASGTTVTVVDQIDGTVHETQRTTTVGGRAFDDALHTLVVARGGAVGADSALLDARLRTAKEHLSTDESVTLEHVGTQPITVTRAEFVDAAAPVLAALSAFVHSVVDVSGRSPDAVAVIGGGSLVPAVIARVEKELRLPVVRTAEPDVALAKGAALLVRSSPSGEFPVHTPTRTPRGVSLTRVFGVLAAAAAAIAVVMAYGLQVLGPATSRSGVSPAATVSSQPPAPIIDSSLDPESDYTTSRYDSPSLTLPSAAYPRSYGIQPTVAPAITPTPSLRPAPDLPTIALPELSPTEFSATTPPSPVRQNARPPVNATTSTPPTTTTPPPETTTDPPVTTTPDETDTPTIESQEPVTPQLSSAPQVSSAPQMTPARQSTDSASTTPAG